MYETGRDKAKRIIIHTGLPIPKEENVLNILGVPREWPYDRLWMVAGYAIGAAVELGCSKIRMCRGLHERVDIDVIDLLTKAIAPSNWGMIPRREWHRGIKTGLQRASFEQRGDHFEKKVIGVTVPNLPFVSHLTGKGV